MGLFTPKIIDEELEAQRAALKEEIVGLRADIKEYRRERGDLQTRDALQADVERLKREKVALEIERDKTNESHARQLREVEHKVGLQQQTAEFERKAATQEATLKVREENLKADQDRFKSQLDFVDERNGRTEAYLQDMASKILSRLPTVTVDVVPGGNNGSSDKV